VTQTIRESGFPFILHSSPRGESQFTARKKSKANHREASRENTDKI
jgi:hypothetical protein